MEKTVVIVGAGIAEPATGCHGQVNCYDTRILGTHYKQGSMSSPVPRRSSRRLLTGAIDSGTVWCEHRA